MGTLFKNRKFQLIIIIVLLLVIAFMSINRFSSVNILRNIVTIPVQFVQKIIGDIDDSVTEFFQSIKDYQFIIEENNQLKNDLNVLTERNAQLADLEEENQRLRDALILKEQFSSYQLIGANILSINPSNFNYEMQVDVGLLDNIKIDSPVIASNNALIGRTYIVNATTTTVIPIIDEYSGISGWILKGDGGLVSIRGSIEVKEYGLLVVENIPSDVTIMTGDVIETSGLGGLYPKGIIIGTIDEVFNENDPSKRYAYLRPLVEFNSLKEAFILVTKKED
ncbi:MAG: rod shape-determining protein MreC [Clostridiales bacterium]|nr:rod shape-determining protein MreC [Clostridiales bacterium]